MLEKRDLEMIREIMKEEVGSSEERLKKEITASEKRLEKKIEERVVLAENVIIEEMQRLDDKTKKNLKEAIDHVDVFKVASRISKIENRLDDLEKGA